MNFEKKIEQLKRTDLNCNIFSVYDYNGYTMQELLCQFFTKINECVDFSNETLDLANWLVNEGLSQEVVKKLLIWLEDGTLENLINVNLFKSLNDKIDGISSELDAMVNDAKHLNGESDSEKIENAMSKAILKNKKFIEFTHKEYVIDRPIIINQEHFTFRGLPSNDIQPTIKPSQNFIGDSLIDVRKSGFSIEGVRLEGVKNDITELTKNAITYNLDVQDTDSYIKNCVFLDFNKAILSRGRNLRVKDNVFSNCFICIDINKLDKDLSNAWGVSIRGYDISDNTFHSNGILNFTTSPTLLKINDVDSNQEIKFRNNIIEQGVNTIIEGYHYGLKVLNNNILTAPIGTVFKFIDTPPNLTQPIITIIEGNNLRGGTHNSELSTDYLINGIDLTYFNISNNTFFGLTKGIINANKILYSTVNNNVFNYICSISCGDLFYSATSISNSVIKNNTVLSTYHRHGIYSEGVVSNSDLFNNNFLRGSGLDVYFGVNQGGSFTTKQDGYKQTFKSCDTRTIFNGMTILSNYFDKQDDSGVNINYLQENVKFKVGSGKIYVGKEYKFKNPDTGVMETKLTVFNDLVSIDTDINYMGRRIYIDDNGFVKVV